MTLRTILTEKGLSISGLARKAGISRQAIHKGMDNGFGKYTAGRIADVLGISPLDLLYPPTASPGQADHLPACELTVSPAPGENFPQDAA